MRRIETRKEMLHQAAETVTQLMNRAAQLPEDTSKIVYTFADGWTIREPETWQDLDREGQLMSNCFALEQSTSEPEPLPPWHDYFLIGTFEPLCSMSDQQPHSVYSLRDPNNIPHATLNISQTHDSMANLTGRHNSEIKPEYYYRFLDAGFDFDDLFTDTELDDDPQRTVPQYPGNSQTRLSL